mmetsp:Transcript_39384/g.62951  ORF Transcript_39384/g.62951 Transcript_39384/m.62951 type:complete len:179 (-) Transcript_39384:280-816(-)
MGSLLVCCKDQDKVKTLNSKPCSHLLDEQKESVSYSDIVSDEEEKHTADVDIAYDFEVEKMKEYLIAGYCRQQQAKHTLPSTIRDVISAFCEELICLYIPLPDSKHVIRITVSRTCSVLEIKEIIESKTGIPIDQQILHTKELEKQLHDQVCIEEYNLCHFLDHLTLRQSYFNVLDEE